uniref:Uncharacterized protein n=1 Tax=Timema cristinae TaxID=61476 RepID=A0A7R9D3K9_TIMCR|nr:unnamed protein product [Timema cristinae]
MECRDLLLTFRVSLDPLIVFSTPGVGQPCSMIYCDTSVYVIMGRGRIVTFYNVMLQIPPPPSLAELEEDGASSPEITSSSKVVDVTALFYQKPGDKGKERCNETQCPASGSHELYVSRWGLSVSLSSPTPVLRKTLPTMVRSIWERAWHLFCQRRGALRETPTHYGVSNNNVHRNTTTVIDFSDSLLRPFQILKGVLAYSLSPLKKSI